MSRYAVVLDACVLVPAGLRDTLLRLAERGFYRPYWSTEILGEVERSLTEKLEVSERSAMRLIEDIRSHFPEAMIDGSDGIKPELPDPQDEHVLATAIRSEAQAIVTLNTRHFPHDICRRFDIEPLHPDDFLVYQFDLAPDMVRNIIYVQAGETATPALGLSKVINQMRIFAPNFAQRLITEIRRDIEEVTFED
jgi:predicted nucleic acid-binding protein